jgi:hypothetical protein
MCELCFAGRGPSRLVLVRGLSMCTRSDESDRRLLGVEGDI